MHTAVESPVKQGAVAPRGRPLTSSARCNGRSIVCSTVKALGKQTDFFDVTVKGLGRRQRMRPRIEA